MSDMEGLRRDCEKLRECYDAAIRERDAALDRQHAAEAKRDEALRSLAAERAAVKGARWAAVWGSAFARLVCDHECATMRELTDPFTQGRLAGEAARIADLAEAAWEAQQRAGTPGA